LKINPSVGTREKLMRLLVIWAVKRTIAIFTKLFPTKRAARSCSGSDNSLITKAAERFLFDLSSLISFGSSEKSATSDPEISAEMASRTITINKPARVSDVKGLNPIFPRSVSKKETASFSN
jgi:hypothetical protein